MWKLLIPILVIGGILLSMTGADQTGRTVSPPGVSAIGTPSYQMPAEGSAVLLLIFLGLVAGVFVFNRENGGQGCGPIVVAVIVIAALLRLAGGF